MGVSINWNATKEKSRAVVESIQLADYDALRGYVGAFKSVNITGYSATSAPSGIAGLFTRDDSDTTSADNGGTIIIDANSKRWKRVYDGAVYVRWFGAKEDATTDDTSAIQSAIDSLSSSGGEVRIVGTPRITSTLTLSGKVDLVGISASGSMDTGASTVGAEIIVDGAVWGITVNCTNGQDGPSIRRLRLKSNGSALGGIWIKRGLSTIVDTVRCRDFPVGIKVGDTGQGLYWVRMLNCSMWHCTTGYHLLGDFTGSITIRDGGNIGPGKATAGSVGVLYEATNGAPVWIDQATFDSFETGTKVVGSSANFVIGARYEGLVTGVDVRGRNVKVIGSYFYNMTDAISFANSTASATERAYIAGNFYGSIGGKYINFPSGFSRAQVAVHEDFPSEGIGRLGLINGSGIVTAGGNSGPSIDGSVAGGGGTLGSPLGMFGINLRTAFPDAGGFDMADVGGGSNGGIGIVGTSGAMDFYTVPSDGTGSRTLTQATLATYRRGRLASNGNWLFGTATDNFAGKLQVAGVIAPEADNTRNLGTASYRWGTLYAGTGTINTSDAREKQQVRELSDAERAAAVRVKGLLRAFKFNDAVQKKGDGARIHFGVMAQEVCDAFAAEGLDAANYGLFCYDEWNGGSRYGVRYEELLAFALAAL